MYSTQITILNEPDLSIVATLEANKLKNDLYMESWHFQNARQDWSDTKDALNRPYALVCKFNAVRSIDEQERQAKCIGISIVETKQYNYREEDNAN